jgi:hypothetical protein
LKPDPPEHGTIKTSSILIGEGTGFSVYQKLEEVPPRLRRKLVKSTAGANAGTVLIADRRGARELMRANVRANVGRRVETRPDLLAFLQDDIRQTLRYLAAHWWGLTAVGLLALAVAGIVAVVRTLR